MNRLDYELTVQTQAGGIQDGNPGLTRYIRLVVYLKAAVYAEGPPEVKLDSGSYDVMPQTGTSGVYRVYTKVYQDLSVGVHTLSYKDSRGEKIDMVEANILAYDADCGDLNDGLVSAIKARVYETGGLDLRRISIAGDDYNPYEYSLDGGSTWRTGDPAHWTAAELDAMATNTLAVARRPTVTNQLACLINSINSMYIGPAVPVFNVSLAKSDVTVFGGSDGTITTTIDAGVYTYLWNDGATTQNRTGLTAGTYSVTVTRTSDGVQQVRTIDVEQPDQLTVDYNKQDVTVAGGSDGEIQVVVSGGSGSFTVSWFDDATTSLSRSGLSAGTYSVQISDTVTLEVVSTEIEILDAVVEPTQGTLFEVGFMNSISFVVQPLDSPNAVDLQTPDNTLFCKQYFPGLKLDNNYFQRLCFVDSPVVQFNSDFEAHTLQLFKYGGTQLIKNIAIELKEQNLGVSEQFAVTLRAHNVAGKTRVYFNVGAPPIPVTIGDSFEITNNADGFNGTYLISDILVDPAYGYAYLAINTEYSAPNPTSPADGLFSSSVANYNVYEGVVVLSDVPAGYYYLKLTAQDSFGNFRQAISEPIDVREAHKKSIQIKCRNNDNDYGNMTWTTGYETMVRVDALMILPLPGSETSTSRDADYSLIKVSAKNTWGFEVEFFFLPTHMIKKLAWIFNADNFTINGVAYQSEDGLKEATRPGKSKLIHTAVKVEQLNVSRSYNSDDIGSVNDGGFLEIEGGLLKL